MKIYYSFHRKKLSMKNSPTKKMNELREKERERMTGAAILCGFHLLVKYAHITLATLSIIISLRTVMLTLDYARASTPVLVAICKQTIVSRHSC